jgi:hypothetical protein
MRHLLASVPLLICSVCSVWAEGHSATLAELVRDADCVAIGKVGIAQSTVEDQPVSTLNGQVLSGRFVFTYTEVQPVEHLVGESSGALTVRVLGGLHPGGRRFTTYIDAPALPSGSTVLAFLQRVPERGPQGQTVYQVCRHQAGLFMVAGEGPQAAVSRPLPNSELGLDPIEGIGEGPVPLDTMKRLISAEATRKAMIR